MDSIAGLPGHGVEVDSTSLLTPGRLAALSPRERAAWQAYVARSQTLRAADVAAMRTELASAGAARMTRAPYVHDFGVRRWMTAEWFASDSAQAIARSILTYQTPSGGWSKHVDFAAGPRAPGQSYYSETDEWRWIATLDNEATTAEMRFLALADRARPDPAYRAAFARGLEYLLAAQMPTGCWPQVYPLQGGYHDAATFNDDAFIHAAELLRDVAAGEYVFVSAADVDRTTAAVLLARRCIVRSQARVDGRLTVWGQQHDPIDLTPTHARSYEPASLTAQETVPIVQFLMRLPDPSPDEVAAVHAAVGWLRTHAVRDVRYEGQELRPTPGAPPLWARMYEIASGRPIFSNRDGVILYDWNALTDRRRGYGWFTDAPARLLERYPAWAARHPRTNPAAGSRP